MKKILLSLATMAAGIFASNASVVTFDFTSGDAIKQMNSEFVLPTAASSGTNANNVTFTLDGVGVTGQPGSTEARIWMTTGNTFQYRLYTNGSLNVKSEETINNIQFTCNANGNISAEGYANGTWAGSSNSVDFSITGSVQITKIVVYTGEDNAGGSDQPSNPADAPDPDSITGTITVAQALSMLEAGSTETVKVKGYITKIDEINTSYGNATYYIADEKGGTPTLEVFRGYWVGGEKFISSTQLAVGGLVVVEGKLTDYNGTFELGTGNTVLGYKAPEGGGGAPDTPSTPDPDSITGTITVAQALSMIEAGSTETAKVKGYITKIDEVSTSYGNATYYIADEKGGATSLEVYRGYWVDGEKFTSTNQIEVGGLIVVEGKLTNYNGTYEIGTGSKVLGYKAPEGGGGGDTPELPEGVLYMNSFETSISDWTKVNDTSIGDYAGWKVNTNSPACAIANSYYGGVNNAANARLQKNFDLSTSKNVSMSFEQAFGFIFPTSQTDNFRVYVISDGYTEYLTMSNFPPAPASGNWTKEWAINEFDLSEYDGGFITIGFEYNNPGGDTSMAWEIKNFVLYGDGTLGAVEGIEADNDAAPVYYNLQGVRVNNPEKGLYIVVKGNKATKVIF